jgi:4-aminobutyrate aminotransferase-like enzyme/Ser/Thr protein kinase RdoA (MazF antagonist)
MSTLADHRPRFSTEEAVRLTEERYGLSGAARPLPSERDQNFYLETPSGEAYVLKIASAAELYGILDFQNRALDHLGSRQGDGVWPRVCRTRQGETIVPVVGPDGATYLVRMLTYLPGRPLARVKPHTPELLHSLGAFLGRMDRALLEFDHPATQRDLKWNMDNGPAVIHAGARHIPDADRRALVEHFCAAYEAAVVPALPSLRRSVVHNDANDYNVLVGPAEPDNPGSWQQRVTGLIDFGDMIRSYTVCDLAIALAYAMLGKAEPLAAAGHVVRGYHETFPLTEQELDVLFHLACMRLCMSVTISAQQQADEPDNPYLSVSEQPAWALLARLRQTPPELAHYRFRHACGLPPCPRTPAVVAWLRQNRDAFAPVMGPEVDLARALVLDLSVGSPDLAMMNDRADMGEATGRLFRKIHAAGASIGVGRYDEARQIYTSDQFTLDYDEIPERRTIHLGLDLFRPAGSPVYAPLDGAVHSFRNNAEPLDYGPCIILEHRVEGAPAFYTLYGHLSLDSLDGLYAGKAVRKGERIAALGDPAVNGGWPPHLHFQIITDLLGRSGEFPGVAPPGQREVWLSLSPDPNLIAGVPDPLFPPPERPAAELLQARRARIGRSLSVSYRKPLKIVRGYMQHLYDEAGRAYLDAVNNVPHVGHCHPRVVRAGQLQMAVLNTNTRYLHDHLVTYAERLCATLPEPLRVCFFVNSGSEANDLAIRLARARTGQRDMLILDGAYHGNLTSLIDISPYKFDGPGGEGAPGHVHKLVMPDPYRGVYKGCGAETGAAYARQVREKIDALRARGRGVCAFIAEPLLGCGGQIVLPDGYLAEAYRHVRAAGGLCIADEVQVGFGRVGTHFWGFETQGAIPDILTLGKPIGNGHPLGAVVTTPEIADAFANGMEYFNTFGGNPVSCAIGMAVLDVMRDEGLQENALRTGSYLMDGLRTLMDRHPLIGDVRGLGFYIGVELVRDRGTLAPAGDQAAYIANRMRDHGVLISTDGPLHNVLKIKPPMVFTRADADYLLHCLGKILQEDFAQG